MQWGVQKVDKTKAGILIGSGMGGLTVFQDGVKNMVEKSHKKISPFFIPYAITNMCAPLYVTVTSPDGSCALDLRRVGSGQTAAWGMGG